MARESDIRRARESMARSMIEHAQKTGQRVSTREIEAKASEIARRVDRRESEKK
jgi:hypothetical protein